MQRRHFLSLGAATGLAGMSVLGAMSTKANAASGAFEVTRSKAEWKAMLSSFQYKVMREEATERAGSSPLDKNYKAGT